jgi:NodT family efflux transporter outer membrane factor (OMF) lipoprotein
MNPSKSWIPTRATRFAALVAVSLATAGCTVGEDYREPEVEVAAQWTEPHSVDAGPIEARWWQTFQDPKLDELVSRALAGSLELGIAEARVREARAIRASIAGQWDPQLDGRAGYSRAKQSETVGSGNFDSSAQDFFDVGFDARWEIDLFGMRERAIEAADANVDVTIEDQRDVQITLLGEVARTYLDLRGFQRQIVVTRANLEAQEETVRLTRARFDAGISNDLDLARAEALATATGADIPLLQARVRADMHALSVLLGEEPGPLARELEGLTDLPTLPTTIVTGLPADLLRRRPDVRRAERELARATAETGQATAALYPSFALVGSIGQQSSSFSSLFDAQSNAWSFGAGVTAPLLNGGTLRANLEAADARAEQARLVYRRTVLAALAEVESSLAAVDNARTRLSSLQSSVESSERAVRLATELNKKGIVSFFEVLVAQQQLFRTQSTEALSVTELATQTVALYKALGGGWDLEPADAAAER